MSDEATKLRGAPSFERRIERGVETLLFAARWLALPIYLGFVVAIALVVVKFLQLGYGALIHVLSLSTKDLIVAMLRLVDLSLVANLLIIVMFAGYENFVSRVSATPGRDDRPDWLDHIDFAALKRKVLSSILVISAVDLLERFMDIENQNRSTLVALGALLLLFAVAAVLLAVMDRLTQRSA